MAEKRSKLVEVKTKPTAASVEDFLNAVPSEQRRRDSFAVLEMMREATGDEPKMWGPTMIGFGESRYTSPNTGREVDFFRIGFSPRKSSLVLYIIDGTDEQAAELKKLGKNKTGKSCLYINKLDDVDTGVLKGMIKGALKRSFEPGGALCR